MSGRLLYLVRHGQEQRPDDQRRFIGQVDPPLSEEGCQQARRLGRALRDQPIDRVYCSDLARSRATAAELVAARAPVEVIARAELREIALGSWEDCTFSEIGRRFPEAFAARGRDLAGARPPGGESFADCQERVLPALRELRAACAGNLVIVGHAGVNRVLLCHVLGMPLANLMRIRQDHGCLNILRESGAGLEVLLLNGRPGGAVPVTSPTTPPGIR